MANFLSFVFPQFRPDFNFRIWPRGMRMSGNRTLFGKSTTDFVRGSHYVGVKSPRRTNDLFVLNNDDVLDLLRAAVKREGSQTAFAQHHGINRSYLNMVLRGMHSLPRLLTVLRRGWEATRGSHVTISCSIGNSVGR